MTMVKSSNHTVRKIQKNEPSTPLGDDFVPGPWDVICARQRHAREHPGNRHLRLLVEGVRTAYAAATNRQERSVLVSEVVDAVRAKGTGFVRQEADGQWVEVGEYLSREKVGQQLRELIGGKYRSSTAVKKRLRKANAVNAIENFERLVHSNRIVANTISQLKDDVPESASEDDEEILKRFNQANMVILNAMKQDDTIMQRLQRGIDGLREMRQ